MHLGPIVMDLWLWAVSLTVSAIAAGAAATAAWNSYRLRKEMKERERKEMYGWLSQFNPFTWIPAYWGRCADTARTYQPQFDRFFSYRGRVDNDLMHDYDKLCELFSKSVLSAEEGAEAKELCNKINEKAARRASQEQ